jgi:ubiquinone/menaquinone biosynthesis C-methylase UbiE
LTQQGERYVIRGGKAGYDRLLLLARDRWPDTLALFRQAGVSPGMQCLDLGCGGGEVSLELAKLVAPGGSVVGMDMDEVKLGLARDAAKQRKIDNVEFRTVNANEWNEVSRYDLVYSRFLLQHLSQPVALLQRMWAGVRPEGLLIVEDADFDGCWCDPPNDGFDFFLRNYCEVARRNGGDPSIGRKLRRLFAVAGIPKAQANFVQRPPYEGETKSLPWTTLDASTEAIISAGLATRPEVSAALTSLAKFGEDTSTLISGPRIVQVWSKR